MVKRPNPTLVCSTKLPNHSRETDYMDTGHAVGSGFYSFIPLEITWVLGRLELVQSSHSNIFSKGSYVLVSSKDALKVFLR